MVVSQSAALAAYTGVSSFIDVKRLELESCEQCKRGTGF